MSISTFGFPTPIVFGAGARHQVASHLRERGIHRPLVVTDRGIAPLPILREFVASLGGLEATVFDGVFGNPTGAQVMAGAEAFTTHGADAVIGFGGGAALDVAKVVAVMAVHPGSILEYAWGPGMRPIDRELPYLITLPTTSGTGSEVGRSSVISDDVTHIKKSVFSPKLLARTVFADPELTLELPAGVTAATGMDALTHNVESLLSPVYHPICDGIAVEGTRIAARALLTAVREPRNLQARADMMMASMMGAIAFQKDLGATHSCAHALGTVADMHHGLANAVMIDHVMRFNRDAALAKFHVLAEAVGVARGSAAESADAFIAWLVELKRALGIPATLGAAGIREEQIAQLVPVALADGCHQTNPRPCGKEDFERMFRGAM